MARTMIINDDELYIPKFSKVCNLCIHLHNYGLERTCDAFPKGIPMTIWLGENSHKKPYPKDGGIKFEPIRVQEKTNANK